MSFSDEPTRGVVVPVSGGGGHVPIVGNARCGRPGSWSRAGRSGLGPGAVGGAGGRQGQEESTAPERQGGGRRQEVGSGQLRLLPWRLRQGRRGRGRGAEPQAR